MLGSLQMNGIMILAQADVIFFNNLCWCQAQIPARYLFVYRWESLSLALHYLHTKSKTPN